MYTSLHSETKQLPLKEASGRIILKGGYMVDPKSRLEGIRDIAIEKDSITEVKSHIELTPGDCVIDCDGLEIWPGLIDMHLHICDLYEVHTQTPFGAVQDGVTTGISPGAGNTFMTPALMGAEVDRGLPMNVGVLLGGANVLGSMLQTDEMIALFQGTLPEAVKEQKMSRNWITNRTAQYAVGVKEHMGHVLLPDESIEQLFQITDKARLLFMSHTQDIEHTKRICRLAKGRPIHLGHANAVGCGTHQDPVLGMKEMLTLCQEEYITGEFVTTMLRSGCGSREGLKITESARHIALQALSDKVVKILVSDGQNQSTMKGFGDTRDNIPCLLELIDSGVLSRLDAVATMTKNPSELLYKRTGNEDWKHYGNLEQGSYANIILVDTKDQMATYVITNGKLTSFENRYLRSGQKAGYWVSRFGTTKRMGVGELPLYEIV